VKQMGVPTAILGSEGSNQNLDAFALYLSRQRGMRPRSVTTYVACVRQVFAWWEPRRDPHTDTPWGEVLASYIQSRALQPSTINRLLAAWKAYGKHRGWRDPTAYIDRLKRHKGKPRPVPDWRARIRNSDLLFRAVVCFLAETGLRLQEAWDLDVEPPIPADLTITGKGGRERFVPLSDEARSALTLLGGRMPGSGRQFERRCRALGFTPHMLRHQYACSLAASGADIKEIADLLGHASTATAEIYARYNPERLREANARRARA
jgi:integrase